MICRCCALAFAAVLTIGLIAPGAAPARPAGVVAGHGGVHRLAARPFLRIRHVPPLLVADRDHPRVRVIERHRRPYGFGIYYAPGYGPVEDPAYVEPQDQSPGEVDTTAAAPPAPDQVATSPGGCRSRIYKVPSENGGEREVTVTRC